MADLLTKEELEEIDNLKLGFNVIKENKDYNSLAFRRVSVSKTWAGRLLKITYILNFLSAGLFILALMISFLKPAPAYYASTPSGKLYGPLPKEKMR